MKQIKGHNFLSSRIFRLIICFFLGISTGISWVLIASTLNAWLAYAGVNNATIGVLSALVFPYILQFLWAPIIDNYSIPFLSRVFGRRRAWLIAVQTLLSISIIMLGLSNPLKNIHKVAFWALVVSFFAATQEIVINSYRIALLNKNEHGIGTSAQIFGMRVGNLICGGLLLLIVDYLCNNHGLCKNFVNWSIGFTLIAILTLITGLPTLLINEKNFLRYAIHNNENNLKAIFINPILDFAQRDSYVLVFVFICVYRCCDHFISPMINPFLLDIGFSLTEIGIVAKSFGLLASLIGALLGGFLYHRLGYLKALTIGGILQMISNFMFVVQSNHGHSINLLYLTIGAENVCGSIAASALFSYISYLCSQSRYPATQYSLLSSATILGAALLPLISGVFAEKFGWIALFNTSVLIGILPMVLLFWMKIKLKAINALS